MENDSYIMAEDAEHIMAEDAEDILGSGIFQLPGMR